MVRNDVTMKWR